MSLLPARASCDRFKINPVLAALTPVVVATTAIAHTRAQDGWHHHRVVLPPSPPTSSLTTVTHTTSLNLRPSTAPTRKITATSVPRTRRRPNRTALNYSRPRTHINQPEVVNSPHRRGRPRPRHKRESKPLALPLEAWSTKGEVRVDCSFWYFFRKKTVNLNRCNGSSWVRGVWDSVRDWTSSCFILGGLYRCALDMALFRMAFDFSWCLSRIALSIGRLHSSTALGSPKLELSKT